MNQLSLKIYLIICLALMHLKSWAQVDSDEDIAGERGTRGGMMDGMEDFADYQSLHISFSDILMVVLLIAACYVFGKIWKGCTYMILIVAAVLFFMTH